LLTVVIHQATRHCGGEQQLFGDFLSDSARELPKPAGRPKQPIIAGALLCVDDD
jgi:hypothetical protein